MDAKYIYPDIEFLKHNDNIGASQSYNAESLDSFFKTMKVKAKVAYVEASVASALYAVELAPGVRVNKVTSLQHELSVALQAIDIQFLIPIPGTSYLGIRAVKPDAPPVLLGDYLKDESYLKSDNFMEIVLGRLYDGKTAYFDFKKFSHLLISGTTGSGKSIFIDSVIVNLIYKASPAELKLILIDTHMLNLMRFDKLPHLLVPIIYDSKKAYGALMWTMAEMENRYKLFSEHGLKNLEAYNEYMTEHGGDILPRILIVVDDFADLMTESLNPLSLQEEIDRLVSMSRAAGIHLLLSIQRPSFDVISGTVKMNIPNRIAFKTVSGNDSRLILQASGAEHLNGNGDMLFKQLGKQEPERIQGPYVSDEEIDKVVKHIKNWNSFYSYRETIDIRTPVEPEKPEEITDPVDEFLEDAGRIIIKKQKASVGMIQREFRIGFNRAARIMDTLAEMGVVSPEEETIPRKILVDLEQFEKLMG